MSDAEPRLVKSRGFAVAAGVAVVLAVAWIATLPTSPAYGWDESMHVALPAERMRVALAEGRIGSAFDALLGCAQYPFVQPVVLAFVQSVFGATERVARAFGIVEWCATLIGVYVLARLVVESMGERKPAASGIAPWIAFALAALSPLALEFAGTLFLEVPSALAGTWALVAWMWLWRAPSRRRAIVAGALVTVALFTKWNYGVLLGAGLALDFARRCVEAEGRAERLRLLVPLALVPVVVCAWWFVLPLPGGFGVGAEHRTAFASFLAGNQEFTRVELSRRLIYATCLLSITPRIALVVLVGVIAACARVRSVATLVLVLIATWLPVWVHPFFLDRFLVPGAVCAWVLGAVGWAWILPAGRKGCAFGVALVVLAWAPIRSGSPLVFDARIAGRALGVIAGKPEVQSYVESELARRQHLFAHRPLSTNGLERGISDGMLDAIEREAGPDARIAWIGTLTEMSPGALQLGILARGGSRERFLRDAAEPIDVDYFADPHADAAAVRAFAERFELVLATDPPDLKGRTERAWARGAREGLVEGGAWTQRELGRFEIARPLRDPLVVTLFACRRRK